VAAWPAAAPLNASQINAPIINMANAGRKQVKTVSANIMNVIFNPYIRDEIDRF